MKAAASPKPLDTTTLTGSGKIQLTKHALAALVQRHGKLPSGTLFQWYDPGNGDLVLRLLGKP